MFIKKIVRKIICLIKPKETKILYNVKNTHFQRTVLVCHLKDAILRGSSLKHTSYSECIEIVEVFKSLGFNVDIVDYSTKLAKEDIDVNRYSLFFGQGNSFESLFYFRHSVTTIFYATGMNPKNHNKNTIARLSDFKNKHGQLITSSALLSYTDWELSISMSNYIFMWGNQYGLNTFKSDFRSEISNLRLVTPFFYKYSNGINFNFLNKTDFLWMGSIGLIHRGLDVVLDYFIKNPNLTLHVLGRVENELEFWDFYKHKLTNNIIFHGFVDISSNTFLDILDKSRFQIYLSCAEGTSGSVLNCVGNGALLPIISKECGFEPELGEIIVTEISENALNNAIEFVQLLSEDELCERAMKLYEHVNLVHTINNFKESVHNNLNDIVHSLK